MPSADVPGVLRQLKLNILTQSYHQSNFELLRRCKVSSSLREINGSVGLFIEVKFAQLFRVTRLGLVVHLPLTDLDLLASLYWNMFGVSTLRWLM